MHECGGQCLSCGRFGGELWVGLYGRSCVFDGMGGGGWATC